MHVRPAAAALYLAAAAAFGAATDARADDDPAVTPYRPTVSTPAALSAPGWVELEMGGLFQHDPDHEKRDSVPYTLKLAFTPDIGLVVGGEAWVHESGADGVGDTTVVLKQHFGIDDARAFGLELGAKIPTASAPLGSGQADYDVNGIYSADFGGVWHTDLNLNLTRLGAPSGQPVLWQTGWAAALSRSLGDAWGADAELSGTHVPGELPTSQLLVAGTWNASHAVVLDAGFAHGLDRATPKYEVFFGGTFRLGRVF
jgi:hypothetical protein